jgi:tRNA threonylcarbamoyladenosine biosynthesis protein TsaB
MGETGVQMAGRDTVESNQTDNAETPLILAVETSSRIGSVALALGPELLSHVAFSAPLHHSLEILPSIERLLERFGRRPQDIRQIHIATGPGSFTGLRIAVAMAKAMCLAGNVRIVTIDTLDTIAANVTDVAPQEPLDRLVVVLDAKRGQFFAAAYDRIEGAGPESDSDYIIPVQNYGFWRKIEPDSLMDAPGLLGRFASPGRPVGVVGDGLLYYSKAFDAEGVRILDENLWSPSAAKVHALAWQKARLGRFTDPLALVPFYLRGPDVTLRKA